MARPHRIVQPGSWHHVYNRGADRQDIFTADVDRVRFESILGDTCAELGLEIHAYTLMTNHFHLLVHCPDGGLSTMMQRTQSAYAARYNDEYGRCGPLFGGRFRSVVVGDATHRQVTGRYVHRNALDIVPARALASYRWSSYGVYLGRRRAPAWLTTDELNGPFGDDVAAFRRFVEERLPFDAQAARSHVAFGSPERLDDVELAVAAVFGIDVATVRRRGRNAANDARLMAVMLAVELRCGDAATIAARFGMNAPTSARTAARRGRVRLATDPRFARRRDLVLSRLRRPAA